VAEEVRDGVRLTNLDQPLYQDAGATKGELVDYLDTVHPAMIAVLAERPLSVIRVRPGQPPFMQKNLPPYAPDWLSTARVWAASSRREVRYPLCNNRRTLLWLANQRAVEYHPALLRVDRPEESTHLVLDLDPPDAAGFTMAVTAAGLVREALADAGLTGAVKTSGAKGLHIFVPLAPGPSIADVAAATRAVAARAERLDPELTTTAFIREDRRGRLYLDPTRAGGATVVAAYSPRARAGLPVSFPVAWSDLDQIVPGDFTVHTAGRLLAGQDRWQELMPAAQVLSAALIEEGNEIPAPRVQAMHEGRRRARAKQAPSPTEPPAEPPAD
jgi:DNA ligase D-like protein (predicted polymerase)